MNLILSLPSFNDHIDYHYGQFVLGYIQTYLSDRRWGDELFCDWMRGELLLLKAAVVAVEAVVTAAVVGVGAGLHRTWSIYLKIEKGNVKLKDVPKTITIILYLISLLCKSHKKLNIIGHLGKMNKPNKVEFKKSNIIIFKKRDKEYFLAFNKK